MNTSSSQSRGLSTTEATAPIRSEVGAVEGGVVVHDQVEPVGGRLVEGGAELLGTLLQALLAKVLHPHGPPSA